MVGTSKTFINNNPPACDADDLNGFNDENKNLIISSGQTPSDTDNEQTDKAVSIYSTRGDFYKEDTGSAANAYILTYVDAQQPIISLKDGMRFRFRVVNQNTGSSTVNLLGLGVKQLLNNGASLIGGDLAAGSVVTFSYNSTFDRFDLFTSGSGSGGAASGAGLETLALKNSNEKQYVFRPLPNAKNSVESFVETSNLQIWPRKVYDASVDTITMYLDHGRSGQLKTQNDFETIGDFTAGTNTPTLAADTTNYLEGTQSVKMSKASLNGSIDMYDTVVMSMFGTKFRTSFYPDTLSNVVRAYLTFYTSAGNDVTYYFPVANMTATTWNNFTVDLTDTPDASTGSFNPANITRIYYGFETNAAQTVNVSWDLSRIISAEPLLVPNYTMELPIQDSVNQEIVSIVSVDSVDSSKFTITKAGATATQLDNDYPNGLSPANLGDVYISNQTGNVSNKQQTHKSTASGQNAKTAKTVETIYLPTTVDAATLEAFVRYIPQDTFEVTSFPTTGSIKVASSSDKSSFFKNNNNIFLFKRLPVMNKEQSMKGSHSTNFIYLQLNADATYAAGEITLSHDGDNSHGSDDTGYFVVRADAYIEYITGNKDENAVTSMTPEEFLVYEEGIPFPEGLTAYWDFEDQSVTDRVGGRTLTVQSGTTPTYYWDSVVGGNYGNFGLPANGQGMWWGVFGDLDKGTNGEDYATFEAWVQFENTNVASLQMAFMNSLAGTSGTAGYPLIFYIPDNNGNLHWGESTTGSAYFNVNAYSGDKIWHYIVGRMYPYSASEPRWDLWIDGVFKNSFNANNTHAGCDGHIYIGNSSYTPANERWEGKIGECAFWKNTAMTDEQIIQRYNDGIVKRYGNNSGYTIKYKAENLLAIDKVVFITTNDRADTTNQNPIVRETNGLLA